MTEKPILFSAPMVRALLEGRKTQTRRVIKPILGPKAKHTYTRDKIRIGREPSSDAWKHRMPTRNEYRVFVRVEKGHCERTGHDLIQVVNEVFADKKINLPSPQ